MLFNLAYDVIEWQRTQQRDWKDFLFFKKEDILALFLVLLSIAGVIVREKKGWILTIQVFYAFVGAGITFVLRIGNDERFFVLIGLLLFLLSLIIVMHSSTLKKFYRIEVPETMVLNNAIALTLALLASFLMW